jgi:hypothetical protein
MYSVNARSIIVFPTKSINGGFNGQINYLR